MKEIKREYNNARTLQQNSVTERKNRTLIEAVRTMLADSLLTITFWAEAVNTACYVLNRALVTKPHNKTLYELLNGRSPRLDFIRPFGCPVTILNTLDPLGKFKGKADEGFLILKPKNLKRICMLGNQTDKNASPLNTNGNACTQDNVDTGKEVSDQHHIVLPLWSSISSTYKSLDDKAKDDKPKDDTGSKTVGEPFNKEDQAYKDKLDMLMSQEKEASDAVDSLSKEFEQGCMDKKGAAKAGSINSFNTVSNPVNAVSTSGTFSAGGPSSPHPDAFILDVTLLHKVWKLVDLPYGKKAIETKWVYMNKKDEKGIVVRNKARMLAQGHLKEKETDYDEVFAPVARNEAIRIFLAFASFMGFIVYQMDVKSAFLYDIIEEDLYVSQPPCFIDPQFPNKVYKVEKALYGLHQAPKAWYETLSTFLLQNGYRRGIIDKTLFIKTDKDDIMLVQVKQSEEGIFISQDKYVAEILKKFDFSSVRTASTPIETHKPLVKDEEAADVDVYLYRSMIGSLMYLTAYRPDIMFAVCACSRFQVTPKLLHLHAVKRIFRKSATEGCQFLGRRLISWQCKKQTIVAISTTEAEYVAAANCCGQNTANSQTINDQKQIHATVDGKILHDVGNVLWYTFIDVLGLCSRLAVYHTSATLNEPNLQGEGSGSGFRCQETMGGAMAQIRPEGAPIQSNDPPLLTGNIVGSGEDMMEHEIELTDHVPQTPHDLPLSGGHTPRSDEGSITLKELTDLCTTLSQKIDADHEVVATLTHEEQEKYTAKERSKLLAEFFERKKKQIAKERAEAIKSKATTKTQLRNLMMIYLKHTCRFTHAQLKSKSFEEIQKLYTKEQKWVDAFVTIGSEEDEKGVRSRKERENDDDKAINYETLGVKSPIVDCESQALGTMEAGNVYDYKLTWLERSYRHFSTFSRMLKVLDRQDVLDLHKIVMERFPSNDPEGYDLILWGDLKTLMESSKDDEI
uniref:Putative ribonuclease H-like domain-containing protein n=1 Tax=Tanacetum cinerariifolium TaxID=118510 RepID=A0A6L2J0J6_TANCI|nr:putative ribonuclease H-like domain-containing protein [Tanacetum cinerariifolium]